MPSVFVHVCVCVCVCVCVDVSARSVARCRSVKRAYQASVENAFGRLLLVVLDNGKVFVDVTNSAVSQSTVTDDASVTDDACQSQVLPVFNTHSLA